MTNANSSTFMGFRESKNSFYRLACLKKGSRCQTLSHEHMHNQINLIYFSWMPFWWNWVTIKEEFREDEKTFSRLLKNCSRFSSFYLFYFNREVVSQKKFFQMVFFHFLIASIVNERRVAEAISLSNTCWYRTHPNPPIFNCNSWLSRYQTFAKGTFL